MQKLTTKGLAATGLVLVGLALLGGGQLDTATAGVITKTFEFGPGTAQPRSNVRTFAVPCGSQVTAVVKFKRLGTEGANNDFPIVIELREPDTAAISPVIDVGKPDAPSTQEGAVVDMRNNLTAKKSEQTVTLNGVESKRGCNLPWRVRVKHANDGPAPFATVGNITLDFGSTRNINVEAINQGLKYHGQYRSITVKLGASGGLDQGKIEVTGTWKHWIFVAGRAVSLGPLPVKFKFELIDPSGAVVKTAEGYSSDEASTQFPKLKLIHQVTTCIPGQWNLTITNIDSANDAGDINPTAKFTPDCP